MALTVKVFHLAGDLYRCFVLLICTWLAARDIDIKRAKSESHFRVGTVNQDV